MSLNAPVIQGVYTLLPSAVRTTTQTFTNQQIVDPKAYAAAIAAAPQNFPEGSGTNVEASGIIAYLNITAASGTGGLQLALDEQDPASGVWNNVLITLAQTGTALVKLKLKPSITPVAATASLAVSQDILPPIWRLRVVANDGSNYTYSLGVGLYS